MITEVNNAWNSGMTSGGPASSQYDKVKFKKWHFQLKEINMIKQRWTKSPFEGTGSG